MFEFHQETGKGKSKKLAKKAAAQNMWENLHEILGLEPIIFTGSLVTCECY
jgi:hypothetical protein